MGQIMDLLLDDIVDDKSPHVRTHGLSRTHIESLLSSGYATWPPPLVVPIGEGKFALVDGNHRLAAARELGLRSMPCDLVGGDPYVLAVEANLRHGLPLDLEARKAYARYLYRQHPGMPWREIGRRSGLHHETAKAAIELPGVNRQQADDKRFDPLIETQSALTALLKHLERAVFSASDSHNFVRIFAAPDAHAVLTNSIHDVVEHYPAHARPDLAQAFVLMGRALYNGARGYLT